MQFANYFVVPIVEQVYSSTVQLLCMLSNYSSLIGLHIVLPLQDSHPVTGKSPLQGHPPRPLQAAVMLEPS